MIPPYPGQSTYAYNTQTQELTVVYKGDTVAQQCVLFHALNKNNALKKAQKIQADFERFAEAVQTGKLKINGIQQNWSGVQEDHAEGR